MKSCVFKSFLKEERVVSALTELWRFEQLQIASTISSGVS